jgi:hypothetical protein
MHPRAPRLPPRARPRATNARPPPLHCCLRLTSQEDVDALAHAEWQRDDAVRAGLAVQAADEVREVVQHGQVVLHHNHIALLVRLALLAQQLPDDLVCVCVCVRVCRVSEG